MKRAIAILLTLLLTIMAGCSSQWKIYYPKSRHTSFCVQATYGPPERQKVEFQKFKGEKVYSHQYLQRDNNLELYIKVEKGSLGFVLYSENGDVLYEKYSLVNSEHNYNIPIEQPGKYELVMIGKKCSGSFYIYWESESSGTQEGTNIQDG